MNSACLRCNLRTLNQHKALTSGKYAEQFEIPILPPNQKFVQHPYKPCKCANSDVVCFSLVNGAGKCIPNRDKMLGYNAQGKIVATKVKFEKY